VHNSYYTQPVLTERSNATGDDSLHDRPSGGLQGLELPRTLERVLLDAIQFGHGEVVVHTPEHQDRIFLAGGAIAWVVSHGGAGRLSEVMQARGLASHPTLQRVWKGCRTSGRNFAEALVDEGVVDRQAMRGALLEHNARQLASLVHRAAGGRVVFHSVERSYASDLCFSLVELAAEIHRLAEGPDTAVRTVSHAPAPAARPSSPPQPPRNQLIMSTISKSLEEIMTLDGAVAAALVDWESGLTLGTIGGNSGFDIELAASGNTGVVKSKMRVMRELGIPGAIEDILITLETQYHLIRPLARNPSLFLYVAIDKSRGNLGLARHRMRTIEDGLKL
jgi:hypothetical protein